MFKNTYLGLFSQKNDSYYPQVFLKECRYNEKKVVSHIHVYFSNFSYSFDESDKE